MCIRDRYKTAYHPAPFFVTASQKLSARHAYQAISKVRPSTAYVGSYLNIPRWFFSWSEVTAEYLGMKLLIKKPSTQPCLDDELQRQAVTFSAIKHLINIPPFKIFLLNMPVLRPSIVTPCFMQTSICQDGTRSCWRSWEVTPIRYADPVCRKCNLAPHTLEHWLGASCKQTTPNHLCTSSLLILKRWSCSRGKLALSSSSSSSFDISCKLKI